MSTLKPETVRRAATLLLPSTEVEAFVDSLVRGPLTRPALVYCHNQDPYTQETYLLGTPPPLGLPTWIRVVGEEPYGKSEEHERGDFYCLDLSSAILGLAGVSLLPPGARVVDVCAAPGGKSVLAWRYLSPEWMICNEVHRKRVKALISNIKRCAIKPVTVASLEVDYLSACLGNIADLVIVDAPCSAQSFGAQADSPFFKTVINTSVKRQRRILMNAAQLVKEGGILQYSTCTFSIKENEGVVRWFLKNNPNFEAVAIPEYQELLSPFSKEPSYRIWPHRTTTITGTLGRGGFVAVLRRVNKEVSENSVAVTDIKNFTGIWQNF